MLLQHRLMHHRCVHHQHHCKRGVRCAAAPFDDRTKRALREAGEILSEAQELARQQTLSDLMSSWTADSTVSTSSAPPEQQQQQPPAPSTVEAAASQQQQQQAAADAAGDANINSSSNPAALEAFWCEQGLSQAEAQQLMREVDRDPQLAATCCNTQVCEGGYHRGGGVGAFLWHLGRGQAAFEISKAVGLVVCCYFSKRCVELATGQHSHIALRMCAHMA